MLVLDPGGAEAPSAQATREDEFVGSLPDRLDPEAIRELSKLSPAVSTWQIVVEWLAVLAVSTACSRYFSWGAYAVAVVLIGARQHAILVLAHDAAHYRLFKNRELNDWIGEVFLAWPFVLVTMQGYRRNHFQHHRFVNTDRDPDWRRKQTDEWRFPKTPAALLRLLASDAAGIGFVKFALVASRLPKPAASELTARDRRFARARLAFLLALAAALTLTQLWQAFLLYWVVPYLTWMQLCFHVRSIAEHFGIEGREGVYAQTRTVLATLVDRALLGTNNVNYHLEHHLYPSVPFYRLPELHARLMALPTYRASAHVTRGYLGMLRECTRR